jgi:hypothetical protein
MNTGSNDNVLFFIGKDVCMCVCIVCVCVWVWCDVVCKWWVSEWGGGRDTWWVMRITVTKVICVLCDELYMMLYIYRSRIAYICVEVLGINPVWGTADFLHNFNHHSVDFQYCACSCFCTIEAWAGFGRNLWSFMHYCARVITGGRVR